MYFIYYMYFYLLYKYIFMSGKKTCDAVVKASEDRKNT